MNKIQKLLQELCPNGVEYRPLNEVFHIKNGYTPSKAKKEYWENGTIPWFRMEDIRTNGRILKDSIQHITPQALKGGKLFPANSLIIATTATIGEHALIIVDYLSNQRFTCLSLKSELLDCVNMKFMFYYGFILGQWCKENVNVSGFASVDMSKFKNFQIPLPPLAIQNEIVRILDTFTELETELETELSARRKQYEYYRNKLLSKEELEKRTLCHSEPLGEESHKDSKRDSSLVSQVQNDKANLVKMVSLNEVFHIKNGYTPSKAKKEYWENGTIPWFRMEDIRTNGRILKDSIQHITPQALKGGKLFPANSLIIATTATIGEHALIIVDYLSNQRFTCLSLKSELLDCVNMKFMFYYGFILGQWCKENVNVSGFASVDMSKFKNFQIPLPPLAVQEEIVNILDKFDALVNDLTSGIPAEIAARRKQYEYYREELLSFEALQNA